MTNKHKKTSAVDLNYRIENSISNEVYFLLQALKHIDAMQRLQLDGNLDLRLENELYKKVIRSLETGANSLKNNDKQDFEDQINNISNGIYDLCSINLKNDGKEYIDLILGKIFSLDRNNSMLYAGAVGLVNNNFDSVIERYDKKIGLFF